MIMITDRLGKSTALPCTYPGIHIDANTPVPNLCVIEVVPVDEIGNKCGHEGERSFEKWVFWHFWSIGRSRHNQGQFLR